MYPPSEPIAADLLAIDTEWPVIQAELDVVDAEIRIATDPKDELARRAHRRAVRRVMSAHRFVARLDIPQGIGEAYRVA